MKSENIRNTDNPRVYRLMRIRRIIKENIYPIDCIDESNNINIYKPSQLSFTQFDLVHGGFSHERPLPKIEVDQLIYVKQGDNYLWEMRHFSHFKGNECYCFKGQMTSKETKNKQLWNEYSIENPLA